MSASRHTFTSAQSDAFSMTRLVRILSNKLSHSKWIPDFFHFFFWFENVFIFNIQNETQTHNINTQTNCK